jgi:hypothetical protein
MALKRMHLALKNPLEENEGIIFARSDFPTFWPRVIVVIAHMKK